MRKQSLTFIFYVIALIWVVAAINLITNNALNQFGIVPRQTSHLSGIVFSPFLHGGWGHLVNNTIGFICLSFLCSLTFVRPRVELTKLMIFVGLIGGLLTWIFARPGMHIGLSGVIFGLWGYVTFNGFIRRNVKYILISLVAIIFYGGMFFGVLPTSRRISFEGHLFGALSGIIYCYLMRKKHSN